MIKLRSLALASLMALSLATGSMVFVPTVVHAQVDTGLTEVGGTIGLSATDPRIIASRIINVSLGLLGIIMVSLILYAGFLWMTAGGDAEKVEKAKHMIRNAIIGVVLILSSWAIATFVINALIGATGGGGAGGSGVTPPINYLPSGGGTNPFAVDRITPAGTSTIRNLEVTFILTRDIDAATANANLRIIRVSDSAPVAGTIVVTGRIATFTPSADCPAPNEPPRKCFDSDTQFRAEIASGLRSSSGQTIRCDSFSPPCQMVFTTGNLIDTAPPISAITWPSDGRGVSVESDVTVSLHATDDAGVTRINAFAGADEIGIGTGPIDSTLRDLSADVSWNTRGVALGPMSLRATAHDVDSNTGDSPIVTVIVRPEHCFNDVIDTAEGETGPDPDCDAKTDVTSCGACVPGACTTNADCASGVCSSGICVEQPVITGISPLDGRPGTLVTISGVNFGTSTGQILFANGQVATAPAACIAAGIPTWSRSQVVVAVPDEAVTGSIRLTNSAGLFDVSSGDPATGDRGPQIEDFIVNDVSRPGLCGAVPNNGLVGSSLALVGTGLGTVSDRVFFNNGESDREITSFTGWVDGMISLTAPVITPSTYAVRARSAGVFSNSVSYRISTPIVTAAPEISSLSPVDGPISEYVTIKGLNFGSSVGVVNFRRGATDIAVADTIFPAACARSFWSDNEIKVKVPKTIHVSGGLSTTDPAIDPGTYQVEVVRGTAHSNTKPFAITTAAPRPGICAVLPTAGPVGTRVSIVGERFGSESTVDFSGPSDARIPAAVLSEGRTIANLNVTVPAAVTGNVIVTSGSATSNPAYFAVRNCNEDVSICSASGETCCRSGACSVGGTCAAFSPSAMFAWKLSTSILPVNPRVIEECSSDLSKLPSPSPWGTRSGGNDVCVNADIYLRFNTHIDPASVSAVDGATASLIVLRCTAAGDTPCSTTAAVARASDYPEVGINGTEGFIRYRSQSNLLPATTYKVILTTAIHSVAGNAMLPRVECGAGNAYCFTFTTRPSVELCKVSSINVIPSPHTMDDIDLTKDYSAAPRAADSCIVLRGDGYDWSWDTSNAGLATVTTPNALRTVAPNIGFVSENQVVTSHMETGVNPVYVNASIVDDDGLRINGRGDLFIRLVPPKIIAYGPNCDTACMNGTIWARFNVPMKLSTVSNSNVIIKPCKTENCRTFDPSLVLSSALAPTLTATNTKLTISPTRGTDLLLERGRFYKVTVKGGMGSILSRSGLPLTGLNDHSPDGFSWTFRVKDDVDARCLPESINMSPALKIESAVGERQTFIATPVSGPTACNPEGEDLVVDRPLVWAIEQPLPTVSKYVNGGAITSPPGLVDTNPTIGPGCTDRCTPRGSDGLFGKTASCGNHIVETSDANYCRNGFPGSGSCVVGASGCRTIHDESCQLLSPDSRGSEECDSALATGCGPSCLWNPVPVAVPFVASPTCGNNILNRGEQCDSGSTSTAMLGCSNECQLLGSSESGSVCGNGAVGDGEACDDGNTISGDGCSADCLHEGSSVVIALCHNGIVEPGETCDGLGDAFPTWCDNATCLKKGTDACSASSGVGSNCCGNGSVGNGEDCDGGDGCSNRCLKQGSSTEYHVPSFCGDGVPGAGEINACEAGVSGDGKMDALQLAEIVGAAPAVPVEGQMLSTIRTTYEGKTGEATYGLQCGYTSEASCNAFPGTGLDDQGCCAPRPTVGPKYPPSAGTNICRNALISAQFNERMQDASLTANFVVAERVSAATACPAGTTLATREDLENQNASWWNKVWRSIVRFFTPNSALADVFCEGAVRGVLNIDSSSTTMGSVATFTLERALKADTEYRVTFRGDTNLLDNPSGRQGIRTARGVVSDVPIQWSFRTGLRICTVSSLKVRDLDPEHPNLYVKPLENHQYGALPISLQGGGSVPLSTVAEYSWIWEPWNSSAPAILAVGGFAMPAWAEGNAQNTNGTSYVSAGIQIAHDEVSVPSTINQIIRGTALATVFLCENPWPVIGKAPFSDKAGLFEASSILPEIFRTSSSFYNFSTLYCRDKGVQTTTSDDLPSMDVVGVTPSPLDAGLGVLRQYLFTYGLDKAALRGDGIGIRIVTNPLHQSPSAWYVSKGFSGSPTSITVDGYEALQDGNTIYIGAVNTDGLASGVIYPNIYVISRNPDAQAETIDIFDQMVKNFVLNVNLQDDSQNSCMYALSEGSHAVNSLYRGADNRTVSCTADWECLNRNMNLRCASFKTKMQRDIKRIADFQRMTNSLESSKASNGKYPSLQTGSFLQTLSNSRWPSWQGAFTAELGTTPPVDPVNRFLTCGICSGNSAPCMDAADCRTGETCKSRSEDVDSIYKGIETSTCWNPTSRKFICPKYNPLNPYSVSRFYQYRALSAGARYELSTELEGPSPDRYRPALLSEIKRCTNIESVCISNDNCTVTSLTGATISTGSCVATGGSWKYVNSCNETAYSTDTICGNGILGPAELCEIGDTRPAACTTPGSLTSNNGTSLQVCNNCTEFVNSPSSICVANALCGNGRIDRKQCSNVGYRYGQACNTSEDCHDPRDPALSVGVCSVLASPETCDDGALNGTYGHCNRTCTGFDAYCGDGLLSPGETCDKGVDNGSYNADGISPADTCNYDCRGPAPYCGDRTITAPNETCDGNTQTSNKKLCIATATANAFEPCDTDADCGGAVASCGGASDAVATQACTETLGLCSSTGLRCGDSFAACTGGECIQYPTQRSRSCASVPPTSPTLACHFYAWSACEPIGSCGNGTVDPAEECDDGNRNDNDACTNLCKRNICGDAYVNVGTEECDNGALNGTLSCTADYGSTCISCSLTCRQVASSGGFCGNGVKEGPEQCDRTDFDGDPTTTGDARPSCRALGYDYAETYTCSRPMGTHGGTQVSPGVRAEDRGTDDVCRDSGASIVENVSCGTSCGFTGCKRCSDTPGDGVISGQVFDAVNYLFPVPNARVTLYNRGSRVAETYTSSTGEFAFNTINKNAECAQYRIVVDFYQDNPCTGAENVTVSGASAATTCNGQRWPSAWSPADEGVNGGYWPYESDVFGLGSFRTTGIRNTDGKIFLAPRVGPNETLVVTNFSGEHIFSSYLVVPQSEAFLTNATISRCNLTAVDGHEPNFESSGSSCIRTLYFGVPGREDLELQPHAAMQCQQVISEALSKSCYKDTTRGAFPYAPHVVKFKRGDWSRSGWFSYFLVDINSMDVPPSYELFRESLAEVRIVTAERMYKVRPPAVTPSCVPKPNETPRIVPPTWLVPLSPELIPVPRDMRPTELLKPADYTPAAGTEPRFLPAWSSSNKGLYTNEPTSGKGKYWLVFQQNSITGQISIPSDQEQVLCRGSWIPNEPVTNSPLPWPLIWSDSRYGVPR